MLLALAFVPVRNVPESFEELADSSPACLGSVIDYWEDIYFGRQRRNRRREPTFPIELWSMHDRLSHGLPRTNNSVEGWHHAFQNSIDCDHPSVYKLIENFKKEQDHVEILLERYDQGHRNAASPKSSYAKVTRRLLNLLPTYGTGPITEYLKAVSHNLSL